MFLDVFGCFYTFLDTFRTFSDVFGRFGRFWTFLDFLDVFRRKYLDIFGYIWTYLDAQARGQTQIAQFGLLVIETRFFYVVCDILQKIILSVKT